MNKIINEKNGVERFYISGNEMVWLSFAQSKISYDKLLVENDAERSWVKEYVFGSNKFRCGWVKAKVS